MLELRDALTAAHSVAVARYARSLAGTLGLPERDRQLVHTAALLHDLGKSCFPDRILAGEEPLRDGDWDIIRVHPLEGARVVAEVEGDGPLSEIVLSHHERIDGMGYPRGLAGESIPLLARVISVADCFDAMTARDSYRPSLCTAEALEESKRVAGTQLDADIVAALVELLGDGAGEAWGAPGSEPPQGLRGRGEPPVEAPPPPGAPLQRRPPRPRTARL